MSQMTVIILVTSVWVCSGQSLWLLPFVWGLTEMLYPNRKKKPKVPEVINGMHDPRMHEREVPCVVIQ